MKKLLSIFLLVSSIAFGQARNGEIIKSTAGQAGTVRVCTSAATGTPCSPLATIYSDAALTVPIVGSIVTSDILGNYSYYAAPGNYKEQIAVGSNTLTIPVTMADPFSTVHISGNQTITGIKTFSGQIVANGGVAGNSAGTHTGAVVGNVTGIVTSSTANPASAGAIRLAKTDAINFRNSTNTADVNGMSFDTSNAAIVVGQQTPPIGVEIPGAVFFNTTSGGISFFPQSSAFLVTTLSGTSGTNSDIRIAPGGGASGTANGGSVTLVAGNGGATSGNGGNITLTPGTVISGTAGTIQLNGTVSKYNSVSTAGAGVAAEYATVDLTAQSAAISATTLYAVPATGAAQYRLSWDAKVTTAAGTSSTLGALTITYTDPDGVLQTITCGAQTPAGSIATTNAGNTTTTALLGLPFLINAKASTNIQYAFAYASNAAAAMQYNLHIKLEIL